MEGRSAMIAEIGAMLAIGALVLSVVQAWLGLAPAQTRTANYAAAASASAMAVFMAVVASFALLVTLFLQSDFSVAVVYNNSHVAKPLIYKISGTWGNHEGSMLMWCMVSALFGALFARAPGAMDQDLWRRAIGVQGLVTGAALFYTLLLSNPFARLDPAPWEGRDLNPLLQDPALAAHPPMLYLGYVGMSIPFSLAIAGLIIGKVDQAWARALRPWTILAWTALTCGIALGSYWAYYELGLVGCSRVDAFGHCDGTARLPFELDDFAGDRRLWPGAVGYVPRALRCVDQRACVRGRSRARLRHPCLVCAFCRRRLSALCVARAALVETDRLCRSQP
jgi:cytochrome c-type biogenesis protein CcmF